MFSFLKMMYSGMIIMRSVESQTDVNVAKRIFESAIVRKMIRKMMIMSIEKVPKQAMSFDVDLSLLSLIDEAALWA